MVPNGWQSVRLGDHVKIHSGYAPASLVISDNGTVPYVKVDDLNNCARIQIESKVRAEFNGRKAPKNTILFPKRGAAIMNNKVRIAGTELILDTNMMGLEVRSTLDPWFTYYWLVNAQLFKIADTSTIPQINNKHINPLSITLPPLPEQKKIAEILSTWDRAIETTEKLLANAEALKRALMQQLLTGKRRLKGFEGCEWSSGTLADFVSVVSGPAFQSDGFAIEGLRLLRGSNVKRGTLDWADGITVFWSNDVGFEKYHLQAGDIVVAMDGYVGRSHAFFTCNPEPPVLLVQRVARLRTAKADPHFVYAHICSDAFTIHCEQRKTSTAIAHITMNDIREFPVTWPAFNEQKAIGAVLNTATQTVDATRSQLEKLQSEKRALMQQLLTGKRRVTV